MTRICKAYDVTQAGIVFLSIPTNQWSMDFAGIDNKYHTKFDKIKKSRLLMSIGIN